MFYFTCNESRIHESLTFLNKLQKQYDIFHDIYFLRCACIYTEFMQQRMTMFSCDLVNRNYDLWYTAFKQRD